MCAGACAMTAHARTRSDRTDMRATIDAVLANARATAGNRADMGACANAMFADMCAHTHAQNINPGAHILGAGGSGAHNKAKSKNGDDFHGVLRQGHRVSEGNQPGTH